MIAAATALTISTGVAVSYLVWRSTLTPLGLYSAIWAVTLLSLAVAPLLGIELVDVSAATWYAILVAWLMFLFGCTIAACRLNPTRTNTSCFKSLRDQIDGQKLKRYVRWLVALGAVGVTLKVMVVIEIFGGLANGIHSVGELKVGSLAKGEDPFPAGYSLLVFFLYPAVILTATGIARTQRGLRKWLLAEMLLFLANDFTFASRGTTVSGILIAAVTCALNQPRHQRRLSRIAIAKVAVAALAVLLSIEAAHAVREGTELTLANYVHDALSNPFYYLVGPIPAWSEVRLDQLGNDYPVAYTAGGLYRAANVVGSALGVGFNWPTPPKPYVPIPLGFNTYPQICLLQADFGPLGAQLLMFILGFIFTSIHQAYLRARTLALLAIDICCLTYVLVTPRDEMSFWMSFWFVLLLGPVLMRRLQPKGRRLRCIAGLPAALESPCPHTTA